MALPKIYQAFYEKEIFTFADVLALGYSPATAHQAIHRLIQEGLIEKIRPGKYYTIPIGTKKEEHVPDRYKIGSTITHPYFFSYHSALDIHGVAYYVSNTVYISSPKQFRILTIQDIDFKGIITKQMFGTQKILRGNVEISVSDPERTFLDGLRRLDLVGGLNQFIESIKGFAYLTPDKISDYLEKFNEKSLYQRAGFILELLKDLYALPDDFTYRLAQRVSSNIYYLDPSKKSASKFVKKWNLMIPAKLTSIEEQR